MGIEVERLREEANFWKLKFERSETLKSDRKFYDA
jgi:hypothetical protein